MQTSPSALCLAFENLRFDSFIEQCDIDIPDDSKVYLKTFNDDKATNPIIAHDNLISLFEK